MAQYDVHRIQSGIDPNTPFVVIVQSSQYDRYRRRVVVPLKRKRALPIGAPTVGSVLNPVFRVQSIEVVLNPLDMASVATDQLGARVGSLAHQREKIVAALDELLSGAWG